ncbi:MAG: hypothetical protein PHV02_07210 [Rhodocyclaceae bacterium]|nr:hypothetical protein [Rhodocyclaceae bacterium]
MTQKALPEISQVVSELYVLLKSWAGEMDAFRFQMFARRLVAAEHGRPDAVEWANDWYREYQEELSQKEAEMLLRIAKIEEQAAAARSEFNAGRCSNPRYQAFLDTVENPETVKNNAAYMAWLGEVIGKFERLPGIRDLSAAEKKTVMDRMIQDKRDANLATRLRTQVAASAC